MSPVRPPLHVVAICGSLRGPDSATQRTLKIAVSEMETHGATVDLIELGDLELPFCESSEHIDEHAGVVALRERATRADAFLLGTPEYHNSFSGVLKNALDLLSSEQLQGKLFGLLGVGGGQMGAVTALGHLRYVVRGVGGWSLPAQVSIANAWNAFDGDHLKDPEVEKRLQSFAKELVRFGRLHVLEPKLEAGLLRVIDEDPADG